jgi:hypothetical protein
VFAACYGKTINCGYWLLKVTPIGLDNKTQDIKLMSALGRR